MIFVRSELDPESEHNIVSADQFLCECHKINLMLYYNSNSTNNLFYLLPVRKK